MKANSDLFEQLILRVPNTSLTFKITGHKKDESVLRILRKSDGYYEEWGYAVINSLLPDDAIVMDIGAHIGVISLLMANKAKSGKVISFEPSPDNYALLVKNISDNCMENIRPVNLAMYNEERILSINHVEEFSGGTFLSGTGSSYRDDRAKISQVNAVRLDDWVSRNNIDRLDLIKMDAEGTEKAAIEGAAEVLTRFRPHLIIEFNLYTIQNIQNEDPMDLLFLLKEIFPYIFIIDQTQFRLTDSSLKDILKLTQFENGIVDLFCTFSRDIYRSNTFFIESPSWYKDRIINDKDRIINDKDNAIKALMSNKSFQIGRAITYPYRKIRDIL